jgi:hypothetical protein
VQPTLAATVHGLLEKRHVLQLLVGNEQVDARDVHVHDAAGADVEVADFAIAHLAFGKPDVGAGGVDERVGKFFEQHVVGGLARESDGVTFGFGAESPAVEHSKNNWFRTFGHSWLGYRTGNFLPRLKCVQKRQIIESVLCSSGRSAGLLLCLGQIFTKFQLNPLPCGWLIGVGFVTNDRAQSVEMMADSEVITAEPQRV